MKTKYVAAPLVVVLLLLTVPVLVAHDDAKEEEGGPALPGTGHTGQVMLPDDGEIMGFPAKNVALLSWLTPEDITGQAQRANDIWGYVSPRGREYAIVGLEHGTAFVEVTDPVNPVVIGVIPGASSTWRDMAVYEKTAYSVNESGGGIQVIDLRRIDRGKVRRVRSVTDQGLRTAHNISVNEASGYAYLSGPNLSNGGLVPVDLSNPRRPVVEDFHWEGIYVHDVQVVSYKKGPNAGREVAFAFAAEDGLQILDVTDKDDLFKISEMRYPGLSYSHSGWLNRKRRFIYLNDELDERDNPEVSNTATYIVRVKDLENPRFMREWSNGNTSIDHNSMVVGKFLYQANYRSGYRLFNVKKGLKPREVAYFDTFPEDDLPRFSGAWGVFVFPSGTVVVSDIQRGLFVLA